MKDELGIEALFELFKRSSSGVEMRVLKASAESPTFTWTSSGVEMTM